MFKTLKSSSRGHFDHGWLDTLHSFSFGQFYDPDQMGFRDLRVINEDRVAPGRGFGTHPHKDMEIVTYVLEGALSHRDSLGTGSTLKPGELQRITAGTGVSHSEVNPSPGEPVHLYQIWLLPEKKGLDPSYEQKAFDPEGRQNRFQVVASPDGRDGSLTIHQDASLFLATLDDGKEVTHTLESGRHAWLQILRGRVVLAGQELVAGDGVAVRDEVSLSIASKGASEILLFDLQ